MFVFKLVILVCAISSEADDCTIGTARDVLRSQATYPTPIACAMDATSSFADLSRGLIDDPTLYRIKVLCPRETRFDIGAGK